MRDKFFKLKIQKLLDRLPTPIEFNEAQWAMVYGLDKNRFWVQIAARRTGKSYAAAILAFAKLLEPGQQVMVVAPNFSLSSIIWDYVTDLIKHLGVEVEKFNQKDKVVRLINGSIFRLLSPLLSIFFSVPHSKTYKSKINDYMKDQKINLIEDLLIKFVSEKNLS